MNLLNQSQTVEQSRLYAYISTFRPDGYCKFDSLRRHTAYFWLQNYDIYRIQIVLLFAGDVQAGRYRQHWCAVTRGHPGAGQSRDRSGLGGDGPQERATHSIPYTHPILSMVTRLSPAINIHSRDTSHIPSSGWPQTSPPHPNTRSEYLVLQLDS